MRAIEEGRRAARGAPTSPTRPRSARRPATRSTTPSTASRSRPYRALDLIAGTAAWTIEEGYAAEEDALADLLPGPQAQAGVYAFDLIERRIKKGVGIPDAKPRRIQKVGVVGAGLMATQLATLFLRRLEVPLVITDVDADAVEEAVARDPRRSREAGRAGTARRGQGALPRLDRRPASPTPPAFAGCDLVIEAVFEEIAVKQEVFGALEQVVSEECLLVTNTSSLSVTADGGRASSIPSASSACTSSTPSPCSRSSSSSAPRRPTTSTLATAWDVTKKLGKRGVLVKDAPGVRRQPPADPPVVRADAGARERQHVRGDRRGGARCSASRCRRRRSSPWSARGSRTTCSTRCTTRTPTASRSRPRSRTSRRRDGHRRSPATPAQTVDEIYEAILEALADECRHLLDEGVVASAAEIDACLILGAGFPFFRGGLTKYLDQTGVSQRVSGRRSGRA